VIIVFEGIIYKVMARGKVYVPPYDLEFVENYCKRQYALERLIFISFMEKFLTAYNTNTVIRYSDVPEGNGN
jgi:hypothetical protein